MVSKPAQVLHLTDIFASSVSYTFRPVCDPLPKFRGGRGIRKLRGVGGPNYQRNPAGSAAHAVVLPVLGAVQGVWELNCFNYDP